MAPHSSLYTRPEARHQRAPSGTCVGREPWGPHRSRCRLSIVSTRAPAKACRAMRSWALSLTRVRGQGRGLGCTPTRAFTRPRAVSAPAWPAPLRYATGPTVDPVASRVRCLVALNACRRRTALRPGLLAAGPASNYTLLRMGATRASWPLLAPSRRTCVRSAEPAADANSRARVPPTEPRDRVPTFSVHLTASDQSFSYGCAGATCVRARGAPRPRWPCA
jgi:hypothetical protein